ncbi:hypothetical protein KIN20_024313 [Parelaphostrongylus tenuis]|uniref:Glycosyltransferase family 92 protein n=1 Tax=Parelaphostrongylus tenuis TaxID=148309 RepID=A0AAD5MTC4_PARTN|nr:hypothetical protein KIN20_024313 [Parelaphostrongylus tenuis]
MCLRREGATYISLTEKHNDSYDFSVPITDRTNQVPTQYFAACLAPLHGVEKKWLLLAEFIEHHKLQGVSYFYIYKYELDQYSRLLLDDYVRYGEAEVIVLRDHSKRAKKQWHQPQLQECLTRARGHSKWVAMIDLDERLTSTKCNRTISDYLRERVFHSDTSKTAKKPSQKRNLRAAAKVVVANIHSAEIFFDGYERYYMKPDEAVIRHYRNIHIDNWAKKFLPHWKELGEDSH